MALLPHKPQGRIQDFQTGGGGGGGGGGHTQIDRAISYHFSQKGYHVRACTTGTRGHPRRAVPGLCRIMVGVAT